MDSKTLFARQVNDHKQVLCDLLVCHAGEPPDSSTLESGLVSTRLLAGTCALMDFGEWESLLNGYYEFLDCYKQLGHPWDDRVAQVTSELIEREETLISAHEDNAQVDLLTAVTPDELTPLVTELAALREEYQATPPPRSSEDAAAQPGADDEEEVDLDAFGLREVETGENSSAPSPGTPLGGIITELQSASQRAIRRMSEEGWRNGEWNAAICEEIRRDLGMVQFHARALDRIIGRSVGESEPPWSTLEPLGVVLTDFASDLSRASGRELNITLEGEDQQIDTRFLYAAGSVLQSMITDVFSRCDGDPIEVTIQAAVRNGALRWLLTDNGDNFITDSQLDHEDQLAFYPGLRDVIRTLGKHHGVLWVEPGDGRRARFEFTLPATWDDESLHVWDEGGQSFAARTSQLCEVISATTDARGDDSYGEFLEYDHRRVPLLRLDTLFGNAPGAGDMVAVLGCLERRVALYVPDLGSPARGQRMGDAMPVWDGPPQPVVQVEGTRVPLIDPEAVLDHYYIVTGTMGSDVSSGGAMDDELEANQSQAASTSDVPSPPDLHDALVNTGVTGTGSIEVLVVEQNESMRDVLTDILQKSKVSAAYAAGVEEAMNLIHQRAPRLIISEFRMPTMAAKKLVDSLRSEGMSIPVLVTTSQSGKTADLLVEKLGVSGYLSKPLRPDEVASQISSFLEPVVGS